MAFTTTKERVPGMTLKNGVETIASPRRTSGDTEEGSDVAHHASRAARCVLHCNECSSHRTGENLDRDAVCLRRFCNAQSSTQHLCHDTIQGLEGAGCAAF